MVSHADVVVANLMQDCRPELCEKLAQCQAHAGDPKRHPAWSALVKAYTSRLQILITAIDGGSQSLAAFLRESTICDELNELESWVLRKKPIALGAAALVAAGDAAVDSLCSYGVRPSQALGILRRAKKLKAGAPLLYRSLTIEALNMKLGKPDVTDQELADQFCGCQARAHDAHCRDRVRKRLKELKKVLKRYCPEVLPAMEKISF